MGGSSSKSKSPLLHQEDQSTTATDDTSQVTASTKLVSPKQSKQSIRQQERPLKKEKDNSKVSEMKSTSKTKITPIVSHITPIPDILLQFYNNTFPFPKESVLNTIFNKSVVEMQKGTERNKYNHSTAPAPSCSNNHCMVISECNDGGYSGGYCCDLCNGISSQGHCGGGMKRWFCQPCGADICFQCHPEDLSARPQCLHERCEGWKLDQCADCKANLGEARLKEEERQGEKAKEDDRINGQVVPHVNRIHNLGIRIDALLAFTYKHDCWDWPTWRVVRDIIVPTTRERGRCRYGELPEIKECFGPATVFMSHCWGSKFGDLVGASCHGACYDRIVWIDIFAVRQWPGNIADLDFRGVIGKCKALVVSTSPIKELKEFMSHTKDIDTFLSSDACKAAKSINPFFRLWCVVELTAAIILDVFVVVKGGMVEQDSTTNEYIYNTDCLGKLMDNLKNMIDVESSECAVIADKEREMKIVKETIGVEQVNKIVSGVVVGAILSIGENVYEIDAYVCGEPEAFRELDISLGSEYLEDDWILCGKMMKTACGGGRDAIVHELLVKWKGLPLEGHINQPTVDEKEWLKVLLTTCEVILDAAGGGHASVLKMLLKVDGMNINALFNDGRTALIHASISGFIAVVKILLDEDEINVNISDELYGATPLLAACQNNHVDVVKLLLAVENIDVNKPMNDSNTPLYYACQDDHINVVKLLLNVENIHLTGALQIAIDNNHTEIIQLLTDAGAKMGRVRHPMHGLLGSVMPGSDGPLPFCQKNRESNVEVENTITALLDGKITEEQTLQGEDFAKNHPNLVALFQSYMPSFQRGNADQIGLHTKKKCANGHGLIRFETTHNGFACDLCTAKNEQRQSISVSSIMYGCNECDYDICTSCVNINM